MKTLCIIPGRGGSKGVKRKNIKLVAGKPLISYAIECAIDSKKLTYITVTTEDAEIAAVAEKWQCPVIIRPTDLARDSTPMLPVLLHVLDYLEVTYQFTFDLIVLLQATSPIRSGEDVDRVISMFEDDAELDGVISVVELNNIHASKMYNLDEDGWMNSLTSVSETGNRQDLPPVYYRNGCIYAVRTNAMRKEHTIMVKNKKAYVMPFEWLANIDEEKDVAVTEKLLNRLRIESGTSGNGTEKHS